MIAAIIFGLIVGVLVSSLIITVILMPLLRLIAQDREGFGYTFNTVVWAQLIGTLINFGIEFVMANMQDVEFGEASGNWFQLPVGILLLTYSALGTGILELLRTPRPACLPLRT